MNFLNQTRKQRTARYLVDSHLFNLQIYEYWFWMGFIQIERNVYNRWKRNWFYHCNNLHKQLASQIVSEDYFIVDNMPLEVWRLSRSSWNRICKEVYQTVHDKGYCASQSNMVIYNVKFAFRNLYLWLD